MKQFFPVILSTFLPLQYAGALPIPAEKPGNTVGTVDVHLLAGQSNMQGYGKTVELSPQQKEVLDDVYIWNGNGSISLNPGASASRFGPEIGSAAEISKRGGPAYLIKYVDSGEPLACGWNGQKWLGDPPGPGRVNFHTGTVPSDPNQGALYKSQALPCFQAGVNRLASAGRIPVVRGLVWMQRGQDSKKGTPARRYAANLSQRRDHLAQDFGLRFLPMVFGQVLPFEFAGPRFTCRKQIRAEMALADMNSGCRMVSTDGYPVYPSPNAVHYTTKGRLRLGKAFATALLKLDRDGDGIPDLDEDINSNGVVDPRETDPARTDTNGEGTPDRAEARPGTELPSTLSLFRAHAGFSSGSLQLTLQIFPGSAFFIRRSRDVIGSCSSGTRAAPFPYFLRRIEFMVPSSRTEIVASMS